MKLVTIFYYITCFLALMGPVLSDYTLLALGDPGQIDQFESNGKLEKADPKGPLTMKNFEEVLENDIKGNKYVCKANSVVVLGDMVYTEGGNKNFKTGGEFESKFDGFKERLKRGWETFQNVIKSFSTKCPANLNNPLSKLNKNNKYTNLNLLAGNHLYDVDYQKESLFMSQMVANFGNYWESTPPKKTNERPMTANDIFLSPRMETQVDVTFLDINLLPVNCYLGTKLVPPVEYSNCSAVKSYPTFPTDKQAKELTDKFIQALKDMANEKTAWRVLRLHHPFFNVEGSFQNMENVWKIKISGEDSILTLAQKAKIGIVLASHHHSAQLMGIPYKSADYPPMPSKINGVKDLSCYHNTDLIDQGTVNICDDNAVDEKKRTIEIKINDNNPKFMWTLVIGNSGRKNDPVWDDKNMPASLIFARNEFGGANLVFTKNSVKATYFATIKKKQMNTLIVNFTKNEKDDYPKISKLNWINKRSSKRIMKK